MPKLPMALGAIALGSLLRLAGAGVFLGCFVDDHARDSKGNMVEESVGSVAACEQACLRSKYYVLHDRPLRCFCCDDTHAPFKVPDSECGQNLMGGPWRSAVYASGVAVPPHAPRNLLGNTWSTAPPSRGDFNAKFVANGGLVQRMCSGCAADYKTMVYKRISAMPTGKDWYNLFQSDWSSSQNVLNTDFKLYSSVSDASSDTNAWQFCSYDDPGIGFPRDCGKTGGVGGQWNSLTRGGQAVTWKMPAAGMHAAPTPALTPPPTKQPTPSPTKTPTKAPTLSPTKQPTLAPTPTTAPLGFYTRNATELCAPGTHSSSSASGGRAPCTACSLGRTTAAAGAAAPDACAAWVPDASVLGAPRGLAWGGGGAAALGLDHCGHSLHGNVKAPAHMTASLFPGRVMQLAAGADHSLALHDDGQVSTWGFNQDGQLGLGDTATRAKPTRVPGLYGVKQLSAGYFHSLALHDDGRVSGWGVFSGAGRLPAGQPVVPSFSPRLVEGLGAGVTQVIATDTFSLALHADGSVSAFGDNRPNGQLGMGGRLEAKAYSPLAVFGFPSCPSATIFVPCDPLPPTKIPGLVNVTQLAARGGSVLALHGDGRVSAWGDNSKGQLGLGDTTGRNVPTIVPGLVDVTHVSISGEHALALHGDGRVSAWGSNEQGQLGIGDTMQRNLPTKVPGLASVKQVVAAGSLPLAAHIRLADVTRQMFSLALHSDGTLSSFGGGQYGQLGIAFQYGQWPAPQVRLNANRVTPVTVPTGGAGIMQLAGGSRHSLLLYSDGTVAACGFSSHGQLGLSYFDTELSGYKVQSKPVMLAGFTGLKQIAGGGIIDKLLGVGSSFSLGLRTDGAVIAFGGNANGQLGMGDKAEHNSPVNVLQLGGPLTGITQLAAGFRHSLALQSGGKVFAFGHNGAGQLGPNTADDDGSVISDDSNGDRSRASWVTAGSMTSAPTGVTQVAAGNDFSLAVHAGGSVSSWGGNSYGDRGCGQLGQGSEHGNDSTPRLIPGLGSVKQVAAGVHVLALHGDGSVSSWGPNDVGQLGHDPQTTVLMGGNERCQNSPLKIPGLAGASQVDASLSSPGHSLVLHTDGTVSAFGSNTHGQLGLGPLSCAGAPCAHVWRPTKVPGLASVQQVVAADRYSLVLFRDGHVSAFGDNTYGQLGLGGSSSVKQFSPVHIPSVAGAGIISASMTASFVLTAGVMPGYHAPPAPHALGVPALLVLPCPAGRYSMNASAASCFACARGKFLSMRGARSEASCTRCSGGLVSTPAAGASSESECTACPAAMENVDTAARCACERGRFGQPDAAADCPECACKRCAAGQFQDEPGALACKPCVPCPGGARRDSCSLSSPGFCIPCAPGTFVNATGRCEACRPGRISGVMNAAGCGPCTAGRYQDKAGQSFCEICTSKEFTIARKRAGSKADRTTVEKCPPGVNLDDPEVACGDGLFIFKSGSWHDGLRPADGSASVVGSTRFSSPFSRTPVVYDARMRFYRCPRRSACTFPANTTGALVCAGNTAGPLCALCAPGYSSGKLGCQACSDPGQLPWAYIVFTLVAVAFGARKSIAKLCCRKGSGPAAPAAGAPESMRAGAIKRLRPIFKQCLSFYQVICLFGSVYHVTYPQAYLDFVRWLSVFKFDFAFVFRLDCIAGYSWHGTLYFTLAAFATLTGVQAALLLALEAASTMRRAPSPHVQKAATIVVLLTYALYPSFSNTLFQAFNCHDIDGTRYLRADYRIDCASNVHATAQIFAACGIVGCSIGIPLLYLLILRRHRADMTDGDESTSRSTEHLHFFVQDYKPAYWYWEAVELLRKLVLTGFAVLWLPGTLMQIITAMFVGLFGSLTIARCQPYCGHAHEGGGAAEQQKNAAVTNSFALQSVVMTFLSLFGALLSKINSGFVGTGAVENGYSYATLQWFLIGTAAFVGVFGLAIVVQEANACGAFDLLHRSSQKYLPPAVVALFRWLLGCRDGERATRPATGDAPNVLLANRFHDKSVAGAAPQEEHEEAGKRSETTNASSMGREGSADGSDPHAPQMRGGDTARVSRLRDLERDHVISLSANSKVLV
jgi:alpha-tubulin suppressor-like RCC1 family protein